MMSCSHSQVSNQADCLCSIITKDAHTDDHSVNSDSINIDEIYQVLGREDMLKSSLLDDIDLYLECEDDNLYVVPDIVATVEIGSNVGSSINTSNIPLNLNPENVSVGGMFSSDICSDVPQSLPAGFNELLTEPVMQMDKILTDMTTVTEIGQATKSTNDSSDVLNHPSAEDRNHLSNSSMPSTIPPMINKVQVSSLHRSIHHKSHLRISFPGHLHSSVTSQLFTCALCPKEFTKKYKMYDHKAKMHNEKHLFKCRLCPYKGTLSIHMKKHILRKHMDILKQNERVCQSKGTSCKSSSNLRKIDVESFTWNQENDGSRKQCAVSNGPKKNFVCQKCQKRFSLKKHLEGHDKTVHQEKIFKCEHENCEKKYSRLKDLKFHAKVHTNEFQCTFKKCTKTFRDKYNLQQHMQVHTGKKSLSCHQCSFMCIQKSSLNWHMKTKHIDSVRSVEEGIK
ncbi:unnamed protein product [Owenia fusiformis]|uniref:C2H2-type domain-containing protein n=1 Tax=Owenia fusiformis TaxID=6347 RepID=A0A8S4PFA7_OWEFU|nr:unnamed protein product [Owenia fusiformis]